MPVVVIHGAVDTDARDVPIIGSEYTRGLLIMQDEHYHIHEGKAFYATHSVLGSTAAVSEVLVVTPNTTELANFRLGIVCALAATLEIWQGTTKTYVPGNALNIQNKKHGSSNTSGVLICHTPAGTESNPAGETVYLGAANTPGTLHVGGESDGEAILAVNTAYLVRLTSRADNNAMTMLFDWYDHTEYR